MARLLLRFALVAACLGMALYLLRQPLLEPLLRRWANAQLSALLDAEVDLGDLGGNWLTTVQARGVQVRGRQGAVVDRVVDAELDVVFDPWTLLRGDLAGVRSLRVQARSVHLDLRGDGEPVVASPAWPDLERWLRLCPHGVKVSADELHCRTGVGVQRALAGPVELEIEPGLGGRALQAQWLGRRVRVAVDSGGRWFRVQVLADDPGQLARWLGLPAAMQGGVLATDLTVAPSPLVIAGRVWLHRCLIADQRVEHARCDVALDARELRVSEASIELPGARVWVPLLRMPSPLPGSATWAPFGAVACTLDDAQPYLTLLPPELRALEPRRALVRARLEGHDLLVTMAELQCKGALLQAGPGKVTLVGNDLRSAILDLPFGLELSSTTALALPDVATLANGTVRGVARGALAAPRLDATLALTEVQLPFLSAASVKAEASFDDGAIVVSRLDARGLTLPDGRSRSTVRGAGWIRLPTATHGVQVDAVLDGRVDPLLLADVAPGSESGRWVVAARPRSLAAHAAAQWADGELRVAEFQTAGWLRSRGSATYGFADGALAAELAVEASLPDLAPLLGVDGLRGTIAASLTVGGSTAAPRCAAQVQARLDEAPAAWASWLAAAGTIPSGPVHLITDLRMQPQLVVERLALAWGEGDGGPTLTLVANGPLPVALPVAGAAESLTNEPLVARLRLGSPAPGLDARPWAVDATLRLDHEGASLDLTRLEAGTGVVTGRLRCAAPPAAWFEHGAQLAQAPLRGQLTLADLDLGVLLRPWVESLLVDGKAHGALQLEGTWGRPEPQLELALDEGWLGFAGLPRLDRLRARLVADRHGASASAEALVGAGELGVQARLTAPGTAPWWEDLAQASVQGTIRGRDVLALRGATVPGAQLRVNPDLTVSGTPAALLVQGTMAVASGKFVRPISIVPDLRAKAAGGPATAAGLPGLAGAFAAGVQLDVKIPTDQAFAVRTGLLDLDLASTLHLGGSLAQPRLEGNLSSPRGRMRLPGSRLDVRSFLVSFTRERPGAPTVLLQAEGKRHGIDVQLTMRGPLLAPEILLASNPPLPPDDLLVLVTTGSLPDTLRESGLRGQATLVGGYLAQELVDALFGGSDPGSESLGDRLYFESGREISTRGQESLLFEFRLDRPQRWALQGERDRYEDFNMGLVYRLRF